MQVVHLEARHPCAFSTPLTQTTSARVTHLCHRGREAVLEVHASDASELRALVAQYEALGGHLLFRGNEETAAIVQFATCACCRTGRIIPTVEGSDVLYLPPSGYASGGTESYQFLALRGVLSTQTLDQLPTGVKVLTAGTRPLTEAAFEEGFLIPVGTVLRHLTERQRLAIVTAIVRGYYRIPRAATTLELGQALGVSREAFEALLRKAENKLIAAWIPFLVLGSSSAERPDTLPASEREAERAPPGGPLERES